MPATRLRAQSGSTRYVLPRLSASTSTETPSSVVPSHPYQVSSRPVRFGRVLC
jgi:hypothetical protein